MPNEIAVVAMPFNDMERLAEFVAKSGMFGMKTKEQAFTLMAIAQAEGRHPALAARDYDVIQGKPAKKSEAMARDFLESGGKIEWHALSDAIADATFSHPRGGSARITWDMERAATAGLKDKDLWRKYPRQMLRSRTVSEGVRTIWPSATSGFYESGEVTDMPFSGQTIEAEPEAPPTNGIKLPADATTQMMKSATKPPETNTPPAALSPATTEFLDKLRVKLASAAVVSPEAVEKVVFANTVQEALAKAPASVTTPLQAMIAEFREIASNPSGMAAHDPETGELPAVEIEGEKYLGAG